MASLPAGEEPCLDHCLRAGVFVVGGGEVDNLICPDAGVLLFGLFGERELWGGWVKDPAPVLQPEAQAQPERLPPSGA